MSIKTINAKISFFMGCEPQIPILPFALLRSKFGISGENQGFKETTVRIRNLKKKREKLKLPEQNIKTKGLLY